jgi:hypothetical protein
LKKLWFKLVHRDLYYYKKKDEVSHKGMHNLSGVFINEESKIIFEENELFCFSVTYPKKVRNYYTINESEYYSWIKILHKATGYCSITDIYEIKVNIFTFLLFFFIIISYSF